MRRVVFLTVHELLLCLQILGNGLDYEVDLGNYGVLQPPETVDASLCKIK